jgi:hypothetical protein
MGLEESSTIEWFLDRGDVRGRKDTLLMQGSKRFGPPQPNHMALINALTEDDLEKTKVLLNRLLDVRNWDELLADLQVSPARN